MPKFTETRFEENFPGTALTPVFNRASVNVSCVHYDDEPARPLAAAVALFRFKLGVLPVLGACAAAGLALRLVQG